MTVNAKHDHAFVAAVAEIAEQVAGPHADDVDREARFPAETVEALRAIGALGAAVPTELGGLGIGFASIAQSCEALARRCASAAMVFAMHQIQVTVLAHHLEGADWFATYLRQVAEQQLLIASATSEIGTGGDIGQSVAAAEQAADGVLEFEKRAPVVSYGAQCDAYLTTLRRTASAAPGDQVFVLHHRSDTELELLGTWDTLGMRGTCSPGFVVRARLAPEQVLAANAADVIGESVVPVSHVLWSCVWLGIASDALDRGRLYLREASKRRPGSQHPAARQLAQIVADLSLLRAGVKEALRELEAAWTHDDPTRLRTAASALRFNSLKLATSQHVPRICAEVLAVVGIEGYRNDSRFAVGRHLRDALSAPLMVANERIIDTNAGLLLVAKGI